MRIPILLVLAACPLLLSSCVTDRHGSGFTERERWHPDGHVKSTYYGRSYYYDADSVHDAHVRVRGRHDSPYRRYRDRN